jgi:hypothetical protein
MPGGVEDAAPISATCDSTRNETLDAEICNATTTFLIAATCAILILYSMRITSHRGSLIVIGKLSKEWPLTASSSIPEISAVAGVSSTLSVDMSQNDGFQT